MYFFFGDENIETQFNVMQFPVSGLVGLVKELLRKYGYGPCPLCHVEQRVNEPYVAILNSKIVVLVEVCCECTNHIIYRSLQDNTEGIEYVLPRQMNEIDEIGEQIIKWITSDVQGGVDMGERK